MKKFIPKGMTLEEVEEDEKQMESVAEEIWLEKTIKKLSRKQLEKIADAAYYIIQHPDWEVMVDEDTADESGIFLLDALKGAGLIKE